MGQADPREGHHHQARGLSFNKTFPGAIAVYLTAIPYVRTLIFTLGFVAVAGIFWELIK
jgi:hypothetical protein